jgi:hypothetical protein
MPVDISLPPVVGDPAGMRARGFPLTRFVGEYDWGPDGDELVERVYALQRIWEGRS